MNKQNKSVVLNIRVTEDIKAELQKQAEADKRTLSDFVRLKLEELADRNKKKK